MKPNLGRVLVVDDDPHVLRACTRMLEYEGWLVVAVEHGRAGAQAIRDSGEPFDVVLADVNMPELDGFGLIEEVRRQDDELPVLLMTGDPSLDGAVRAIDSGAVSYLAKPFEQDTLAGAVARAARRHGVARMRRRAASVHPAPVDLEVFRRALARSWLAFQPIVDFSARSIYAYEALIRTDEDSLRRPDVLISLAERLDRVHELGRTVRAHVARAAARIPAEALLFVNVHGLELADEQLFAADDPFAQLAPRIVLEITERIGLDPAIGPTSVAMLRRLGFRIAVDDLGAGYAALGALASLEPEVVKLDISLIHELEHSATKRRVVGAIATLVRELGGAVIAEGVETAAERDAVLDAGIDLMQGFLFAHPSRELVTPVW